MSPANGKVSMGKQMPAESFTDTANKKRKRRKAGISLVLLGGALAWYVFGDAIRESIDRAKVRNFRYSPGEAQVVTGMRPGNNNNLYLPSGKQVSPSPNVICYSRSLSHHTLFGFRDGYSYVQVNGKTYGKQEGPCGSTTHLQLGVEPMDGELVVTEAMVVESLKRQKFHLIP